MSKPTDASLVRAVLAGDIESFSVLVRRYQSHVYAVALGILSDFDLALDAAQEAFLCAYCDLPRLRDPGRFGAWLCGIGRNTAFEIRRNQYRQEALAREAADHAPRPGEAPSAEQLAAGNEDRALVQRALLGVSEKDREALTLYYADGLSYSDICNFLSISQGKLKGRLQRGRKALRKELAMVEQACKDNAPDEAFARRLRKAIRVFGAKGPALGHIPSAYHAAIRDEEQQLLRSGEEGFRVDLALSHSPSRRLRWRTVIRFGLRHDERGLIELARMLEDRSARIRRAAAGWYAGILRASGPVTGPSEAGPAGTVPPGIERLLERVTDENFNVRRAAVLALGAYGAAAPRVAQALRKALNDSKHKVRHAAAGMLGVSCPGCGKT